MRRSRAVALAGVPLAASLAVAGLSPVAASGPPPGRTAAPAPVACPPGYRSSVRPVGERAAERAALGAGDAQLQAALDQIAQPRSQLCVRVNSPERFAELQVAAHERSIRSTAPYGGVLPGQKRAAVQQREALLRNAATVPNSGAIATPLGTTPLIANDPQYPSVNGLGLAELAGRVDSLAYDPVGKRLFATTGTGGVWMSTDLAQSWRSVGDRLPSQVTGSVGWTAAGGGTLVLASGEPTHGGNNFGGLGAFWSNDLGGSWHQSTGVPDNAMGFKVAVDPKTASTVYVATSLGLFRSLDAGRTFRNVKLPTGPCAGRVDFGKCQFANFVTDVVVKTPGGRTKAAGGEVLAAVGYRAGGRAFVGDTATQHSPANGLYRSSTGAPGTFTVLDKIFGDGISPQGFARQERIGRTELGIATGPSQNHDYVYAMVQDAVLFNGGVQGIDVPEQDQLPGAANNTAFNGVYVSADFGSTWTRMADDDELESPVTESALIGTSQALLYSPGIQSWYNEWIAPDPTRQTEDGTPTRLLFGLEEVWSSRTAGEKQDGPTQAANPASFKVIGPYFADKTCLFLDLGLPQCPSSNTKAGVTTTHPDQQSGLWVPDGQGGVTLIVANDGGTYRQVLSRGTELSKEKWGKGNVKGFHTLLPYDAEPAKDGTIWFGLQDNGSGKITPQGRQVETFGGDGFFVAVEPNNSKVAYSETTFASMRVTTDGGVTWHGMPPGVTNSNFSNPFVLDPTSPRHLMTAGKEVVETVDGPDTCTTVNIAGQDEEVIDCSWKQVFNLGTSGPGAVANKMTALDLQGDAAYVGFCGVCDILNKNPKTQPFHSGLATNVGGSKAPKRMTSDGWHIAKAAGLPNRYVTSVVVDPKNVKTVYVTLGGYANREWVPPGSYLDENKNLGKGHVFVSRDAGETFTNLSGDLPDDDVSWLEIAGGQLVAGTELGVYLSADLKGSAWAPVRSIPAAPISTIRTDPANSKRLIIATFGRGVYALTLGTVAAPGSGGSAPPLRPAGGSLPATGVRAGLGLFALLLLASALALRRRSVS